MVGSGRVSLRRLITRPRVAMVLAAAALAAIYAFPASALAPPTPWNGANPFNCVIQNAGFGATGPDPGADPYCVNFNKTNQNVAELGMVAFLLEEPARTAAAVPKCFYFQEDHWRGSLIQDDAKTVIYEFEGHYFFNKATGDGGVWISNFKVAGQTFDPTKLPGFPPQDKQYFGPGTGGFITHDDIPADPQCAARAEQDPGAIYRTQTGPQCLPGSGYVDRHNVGPVVLGTPERRLRAELGPPRHAKHGVVRYCVSGGGKLTVVLGKGRERRAVLVLTTARGYVPQTGKTRIGTKRSRIHHASELGSPNQLRLRPYLIAGIRHGRVSYLAVYERHVVHDQAALLRLLRRAA